LSYKCQKSELHFDKPAITVKIISSDGWDTLWGNG